MSIVKTYKDQRGTIEWHEFHGVSFNLVFSKAGSFRSGDVHPNVQTDLILAGKVVVKSLEDNEERQEKVYQGQVIHIRPGVPHLFFFPVDCTMLEYWSGEFSAEYFPEYRKIVEESLKEKGPMGMSIGQFLRALKAKDAVE